jgi:hypothetical protein
MPAKKLTGLRKRDKTVKQLIGKTRFSKPSLIVFCVIFAAVGAYIIWRSFAAPPPPTVYLSPASRTIAGSTNFTVQIREDSGSTTVNAIQANLTYDSSLIDYVSVDDTGSAFPTVAQTSGGGGSIQIARGTSCSTTCAAVSGDQLVTTITFHTKTTSGAASVAFTTGTVLASSTTNLDILGSLAATAGGTYTVDVTPPTASITSPINGATLRLGNTVPITVNASDTGSGISKVEFYVDGTLVAYYTSGPYSYPWNTTGLSLGAHTLQAKAYDAANNVTTTPLTNVTLADQTAPSAPGSFRSTGVTTTSVALAWNASTDNVGVANYKLSRGGTLIATLPSTTLAYNDTGLTASTTYNYSIVAIDAAGNNSTASTTSATTASAGTVVPDVWGPAGAPDGVVDTRDLTREANCLATSCGDVRCDFWGPAGHSDGVIDTRDLTYMANYIATH